MFLYFGWIELSVKQKAELKRAKSAFANIAKWQYCEMTTPEKTTGDKEPFRDSQ